MHTITFFQQLLVFFVYVKHIYTQNLEKYYIISDLEAGRFEHLGGKNKDMKTLIIDDSKTIRKVLRQGLLNTEFKYIKFSEDTLYEAEDGLIAFSVLGKEKNIELLISDVNMPHLSGTDLMELLADTDKLGSIKVIFVTTENLNPAMVNKYKDNILGLIKKPISPKKLQEHIDDFFNPSKFKGKMSDEEYTKLQDRLNEQILEVLETIKEYAKLEDLPVDIEEQPIKEGLIDYIDVSIENSNEEVLATSFIVLDEYFANQGVKIHIDTKKLSLIFNKHDIMRKYHENIDMFDDDINFDFEHYDEESVDSYFKNKESFDFTYDVDGCIKKYFSPILDDIGNVGSSCSRYGLDYEALSPLIYEMIRYCTVLDYSFETEEVIKYRHYLNKYSKYLSTLTNMRTNRDRDKVFVDIFMNSQHDYNLIEYANGTLTLEKYMQEHIEKILSTVKANYIVKFQNTLDNFLDTTIQNLKMILDYYTYVIERIIWKNVKKNNNLKAKLQKMVHFNSKDFFGLYFRKIQNVSQEDIERLDKFFNNLKRDVIVLSNDYKDAELIKEALVKINKYNPISITTPKLLDTQLSKKYPDIIFIEDRYSGVDANDFLNKLFKTYQLKDHCTIFMLYNDQPSVSSVFIDGYIKKPLTEQILLQNINSL